jgi:tRNA (guanine37-N1)-methyltransferase
VIRFDCVTLFPEMFGAVTDWGVTRRALEQGLWSLALWNPRDFTTDNYRTVDDRPYGGGPGMVMLAEPLAKAIAAAKAAEGKAKVIHLSPQGAVLDHGKVKQFAAEGRLVLLCGRYEGVDERVVAAVDEEVSVGDVVLTGGELAALCIVDAAARLVPGVLGNEDSAGRESFTGEGGLLEHPHYTRPPVWRGMEVPAVLLSGDHRRIERWRRRESLRATRDRRPDLFARLRLSEDDRRLMEAGDDEL